MWQNDLRALFPLPSQTSERDRHWLMLLFTFIREQHNPYRYLEVGSYMGGTLTPAFIDERCQKIHSVDLRPSTQPDARQAVFDYRDASTAAMRGKLLNLNLDLSKLVTFDGMACECNYGNEPFELAFIDAEHTDEAVFADFLSVYPHLSKGAVCAFHDSNLVTAGLENILSFLRYAGRLNAFVIFGDSTVSAVFLDTKFGAIPEFLRSGATDWKMFKNKSRDGLLLEVIRNRCSFQAVLRDKPVIGMR